MNTSTRPMFPHAVDNTILSAFRSCPQKAFRTYVEHWKPQGESVHLVAGGAYAKGLEVARKAFFEGEYNVPTVGQDENFKRTVTWTVSQSEPGQKDMAEAAGLMALVAAYGDFECPPDSAKSLERTCGALEFYFEQYPLGACGKDPIHLANGKRGIEFSFANPLDIRHPVTGDPILYTGRADMIADFAGGVYIEDDKTTSSLGASWPKQWEMTGQFTGYIWSAIQAGLKPAGVIVRGVSILKTKYDTMEVLTDRSSYEVNRWHDQTHRDLERMIKCWEEAHWDYNLANACSEYGGCGLQRVCKSSDPETWLPMYYEKKVWDPLARKEVTLEEFEASWAKPGLAG